ncbi:MAG: metallophosphoesterase family protein [Promethearchaeota archaeon]
MSVIIAIFGDTHIKHFEELPKDILKVIFNSDWVIHVGDYTSLEVLDGLIKAKGNKFIGVYGNADPQSIREKVPSRKILKINERKIAIAHPAFGGPEEFIETKVLAEFKDEEIDILIYGHTHDPKITYKGKILLINPGKGYLESNFYGSPTTIAILSISDTVQAKIKEIYS